ncbi:MAG: 2-oxoglutarate dehydrogenase complex dihydrolipoyllysine-residue succinyltransferase [Thermaerobacter sp.]|nr:2-oxoglutarate dehydrogenase complex dihydrolipoyllysine-residue succinyltransferase [Thermaerobacter sp.]
MFELRVPELGESVIEATVGRWLKKAGDSVSVGEPIVELETDKVNLEVSAEQPGLIGAIMVAEGETVAVGSILATIAPSAEQSATSLASATETSAAEPQAPEPDAARATPDVRRLAREQGVPLDSVSGSGPHGRVTRQDVLSRVPGTPAPPQPAPAPPAAGETPAAKPVTPPVPSARNEERVPMSARRLTIARRLVQAQQTAAMLTTFNEVDMSAVLDLRSRRRDSFKERHGVGLGFMSFFTKAVIAALKAIPRLNAEIQDTQMVLKRYYDIGIAVSTDGGLVVPVIRDADRLSFAEIEQQVAQLAVKARANTLTLDDLRGGTFTITNGGVFGSLLSTPILNAPQVGILGMHKIEQRPVAINGEVVIRPMMYLALSYDHRIVDGSEAVRFLVRTKELLEDPEALLLEG